MFEDSTFESMGRIRTRSRGWMFAVFGLNSSIVLALILVPLIYPEALPRQFMPFLMEVPPPPAAAPAPAPSQTLRSTPSASEIVLGRITVPRRIPSVISIPAGPEPEALTNVASLDQGTGVPGGVGDAFRSQTAPRVVPAKPPASVRVSSAVEQGLLLRKTIPIYPELAKAMRVEGAVVLAATISKAGTIANLRVLSGPPVLQQSALDAVSTWLYRPYLLNGQPVDVETTVNVVFTLGR